MLKWYDTGAVSGSVLPEPYVTPTGKVDETTMGISHEYHSAHARPAQRRGKSVFILRLAGTAAAILLISAAVTAVLQHGGPEQAASVPVQPSGTAQEILAPLPMQGQGTTGEPDVQPGVVELEAFGPALQTPGAYALRAYDAQTIRQPAC